MNGNERTDGERQIWVMINETLDDEQRPSEDFKMLTTTKQTANRIIKGALAEDLRQLDIPWDFMRRSYFYPS